MSQQSMLWCRFVIVIQVAARLSKASNFCSTGLHLFFFFYTLESPFFFTNTVKLRTLQIICAGLYIMWIKARLRIVILDFPTFSPLDQRRSSCKGKDQEVFGETESFLLWWGPETCLPANAIRLLSQIPELRCLLKVELKIQDPMVYLAPKSNREPIFSIMLHTHQAYNARRRMC